MYFMLYTKISVSNSDYFFIGIAERLAMTAYIVGGMTSLCVSSVLLCYWLWRLKRSRNAAPGLPLPGLLPNMRWDQVGSVGFELRALFASNLFVQSWLRREAERRRVGGVLAMTRARKRERDKSQKAKPKRGTKKISAASNVQPAVHQPVQQQRKKLSVRTPTSGANTTAKYSVREHRNGDLTSVVSLNTADKPHSTSEKLTQKQHSGTSSRAVVDKASCCRTIIVKVNPLSADATPLRSQPLIESPDEVAFEGSQSEVHSLCISNTGALVNLDHDCC